MTPLSALGLSAAALALVITAPRLWAGAVVQGVPAAIGLGGILTMLPG